MTCQKEQQSIESEVVANGSLKEPAERENRNEIEDTRNEVNITVIVIDQILQIEVFWLVCITCIHETFLRLFFLVS